MTSAWKLLYIWKSRAGRSSDLQQPAAEEEPPLDSPRDSNLRRTRHRRGNDHGGRFHHRDDPNPLSRSQSGRIHARNPCHRAFQSGDETVRLDGRTFGDLATNNEKDGASFGVFSRMRLIRSNQLPDAVIQARERLVERLGNVSHSGIREPAIASGISWDELAEIRDLSNNDSVNRGDTSSREWFNNDLHHFDRSFHESKRKPSGVNWEALCTLHLEVFRNPEESMEIRASLECCSICLESFHEGDGLIRLHCGHMFHPACLQPWVKTCRCCPYCRANISC